MTCDKDQILAGQLQFTKDISSTLEIQNVDLLLQPQNKMLGHMR